MEGIEIVNFINPALYLAGIVVYITGVVLKRSDWVKDKYIPLILGGLSIFLCLAYSMGETTITDMKDFFKLIYDVVIQGILITACAVYTNQIIKQLSKKED